MKILFFGDIVARAGRHAVAQVLPRWREQHNPDVIIGNVDNLAHGKGASLKTLAELTSLGFTAFTSGDHIFDTPEGKALLGESGVILLRPLNAPEGTPGSGFARLSVGSRELLLVHVMGQVFMREGFTSPFAALDKLLAETSQQNLSGVLVDIHAEATSEKVALGFHLDGRVSAVLGTHTHIPTCDEWVLPKGTAYVTDIGMCGIRESVLGVKTELSLGRFLTGGPIRFEPAEVGTAVVTAMLVTLDPSTGKATQIERLTDFVHIS
jgi:metallophosphoesterase (TIGR00282 family)